MGFPAKALEDVKPVTSDGYRALINKLSVGVMWLDRAGRQLDINELASDLVDSAAGKSIVDTVTALVKASVEAKGACREALLTLSPNEALQVLVSADRNTDRYMAVLERKELGGTHAEVIALREVLRAVTISDSRVEVVRHALEAMRSATNIERLAFFEVGPSEKQFTCVAWSGLTEAMVAEAAQLTTEPSDGLLGIALKHQKTVHVVDAAAAPGKLPFEEAKGQSVMIVPVGVRATRGVLYVSVAQASMNETTLRLVQALTDALRATLNVAALEAEAAKARDIASQRDRLATIGQLVAGVAHEINNPLAFLKSNLHSLKGEVEDLLAEHATLEQLKEVNDIVAESLDGVSRIETLVQALKGTARQRSEKVRFDLRRALNEAVTIFKGAKKSECEINAQIPNVLPELLGSSSALGQVVLNLMQNGLDSMSGLGRNARKLEIEAVAEAENVVLKIRDYGTGIPADVQNRMFEAFYTTKEVGKGTGLGLYICKEIIEGMNGNIRFTSDSNGTTFILTIPHAPELED